MAAERRIVTSVTIPAPQDEVWALLSDTTRYAEWVEDTVEVVRTDGPAAEGSTYDERNTILGPIKGSSRWTVVEHEPPRLSVHRGEGIPIASTMSIEFALQPAGDAATEVTLTFLYEPRFGPLGGLLASAGLHRKLEAGFRRTANNLAALAAPGA